MKVGDTVRLNSGSPLLTVVAVRSDTLDVEWMDNGKADRTTFPVACVHESKNKWEKP